MSDKEKQSVSPAGVGYDGPRYSIQCNEVRELDKVIPDLSDDEALQRALRIVRKHKKKTFVEMVAEYAEEKGLRAKDIYTAAQIDRKLLSKILKDPEYSPAKDTCIAIALALKLSHDEAAELLSRAGYSFSDSSMRDVLIEYFFASGQYDLSFVNDVLFTMHQPILGSSRF